ncbi:DUF3080 family protein [Marinimicrobium sp. C2-29]|uniref:DUF3080 family protein n=1 Tax=Marinimicrobium sp. C2-29 TaxID=3139825 RepID=UPI00313A19E4
MFALTSFLAKRALPALLILAATGCLFRPPAERLLDDYLGRLSRVLDQPRPELERGTPPRMPRPRELQQTIEPLSVGVLDYWGFRECGLAEILGERNSVLGRVMVPSQHLHMDGRLLIQLDYCQRELEDEELLELAADLAEKKSEQWPARYWNATLAAPEMRRFWSTSTEPLTPDTTVGYRESEAALNYLSNLPDRLEAEQWPSLSDLEGQYQHLDGDKLGGKLLQSLQLARDYLEAANDMLAEARREAALCPRGLQQPELEYARNVMVKVFVGEVQPWLASVDQRTGAILTAYNQLAEKQPESLSASLNDYRRAVNQLHTDFQQTTREHVDQWQQLFESCDSEAIESD